jgi:CRP/FNR family transcriptional regulator, cyclic AMP receptor protein
MELKHWYLHSHSLFAQLNAQEVADLHIVSCYKTVAKGDFVYLGGSELSRLFFLKKGRVKIAFQDESGEEMVVELLKEGDVFGALGLEVTPNHRHEFAQAMTDITLCSFMVHDFVAVLQRKPDLAILFSKKVGEKMVTAQGKYADLVFKDSRERVVNFFRLNAQHEGQRQPDGSYLLQMYLTHQDIAQFTAVSRQTVTTIINSLIAEQRLVYLGRRKVLIPDLHRLG